MNPVEPTWNEPVVRSNSPLLHRNAPPVNIHYPHFGRRYLALLVDSVTVVVLFFLLLTASERILGLTVTEQYLYLLGFAMLYDAVCTSKLCTLGQFLLGFSIRHFHTFQRIGLFRSLLRTSTKLLLGSVSILVIIFSRKRRALHDMLSNSLAVNKNQIAELCANTP